MSVTVHEAIHKISLHLYRSTDLYNRALSKEYREAAAEFKKMMDAEQMAIDALREKAEREDPQPLTFEELRQMDGEPVYIVYAFAEHCEWVVFTYHNDDGFGTSDNCWWFAKGYGKAWEAYRHKPKEG